MFADRDKAGTRGKKKARSEKGEKGPPPGFLFSNRGKRTFADTKRKVKKKREGGGKVGRGKGRFTLRWPGKKRKSKKKLEPFNDRRRGGSYCRKDRLRPHLNKYSNLEGGETSSALRSSFRLEEKKSSRKRGTALPLGENMAGRRQEKGRKKRSAKSS